MAQETLTPLRKAAVLLVQLGLERSAKVLAQLRETEVEELTAEIARLDNVDAKVADSVLGEFRQLAAAHGYEGRGGVAFVRDVLEASLGSERAADIMGRLRAALSEMPFLFLRDADARQVLSFLQEEHPQCVALVLAHMPADQAAVILGGLPPSLQADVAHRIATMQRCSPDVVKVVEQMLERRLSTVLQPSDLSTVGGLQPLVDIINRSDRGTERMILEGLETRDPGLAEEVRGRMFMFEDIVTLDDRSVQLVLRQVEQADLVTALKGVREPVRDKVMRNVSERAAATLAEEIDLLGPVRLKVVEEAQAKVVQAIRRLEEAGQIVISRGGEDEFVA